MDAPHLPKLRILGMRRFWLGMIPTIFLIGFWLVTATRYFDFGHNRSRGDWQELHVDFIWIGFDTGCLHVEWGSRVEHLGLSNDPPETWTYDSEKEDWAMDLFPPFTGSQVIDPASNPARWVRLPLWTFPLLWTLFWIWRTVRVSRREQDHFFRMANPEPESHPPPSAKC